MFVFAERDWGWMVEKLEDRTESMTDRYDADWTKEEVLTIVLDEALKRISDLHDELRRVEEFLTGRIGDLEIRLDSEE